MARRHARVIVGEIAALSDADLVRAIKQAWQGMNFDAGEVASLLVEAGRRHCWPPEFSTFRAWITGPPPRGLDRDPAVLLGVMHRSHLPKVEWALIELLKSSHGGDRRSATAQQDIKVNNIHLDPRGTSAPRALIRLAKHRPDLHHRVLIGSLSAHAAMLEAGFRHPTLQIPADDVGRAMQKLIQHYGLEAITKVITEAIERTHP
jgi:hypothetical protein